MNVGFFIGGGYVLCKKKDNGINIIWGMWVWGVGLGRLGLVWRLWVLKGFEDMVGGLLRGLEGEVKMRVVEGKVLEGVEWGVEEVGGVGEIDVWRERVEEKGMVE